MKHITWLAVLFISVSAGWALGCGCSTGRLQPVREKVILAPVAERSMTAVPACGVVERRTAYTPECPNCRWVAPDKNNAAYAIGSVLTFPFRAITGRELGQPDVVATHQISEPMARKVYTENTRTSCHINKCGQRIEKKVTLLKEAGLEPVGERLTTVKVIRLKPMPVAESCEIAAPLCPPVAEQICPAPVAEKVIIRSRPLPVAEKRMIIRSYPAPVMERFSCPTYSNSCDSCW